MALIGQLDWLLYCYNGSEMIERLSVRFDEDTFSILAQGYYREPRTGYGFVWPGSFTCLGVWRFQRWTCCPASQCLKCGCCSTCHWTCAVGHTGPGMV